MRLARFRVGPQNALVLAEAQLIPTLMIAAGRNGIGKSALLFADAPSAELVVQAEAQRATFADPSLVRQRGKAMEHEADGLLRAEASCAASTGSESFKSFYELHGKRATSYHALILAYDSSPKTQRAVCRCAST